MRNANRFLASTKRQKISFVRNLQVNRTRVNQNRGVLWKVNFNVNLAGFGSWR